MKHQILNAKDLGQILQQARKAQNLTQEDVAGLTGTGRRFISELENGKETSQIGKVILVLGALGVALIASSKWRGYE